MLDANVRTGSLHLDRRALTPKKNSARNPMQKLRRFQYKQFFSPYVFSRKKKHFFFMFAILFCFGGIILRFCSWRFGVSGIYVANHGNKFKRGDNQTGSFQELPQQHTDPDKPGGLQHCRGICRHLPGLINIFECENQRDGMGLPLVLDSGRHSTITNIERTLGQACMVNCNGRNT